MTDWQNGRLINYILAVRSNNHVHITPRLRFPFTKALFKQHSTAHCGFFFPWLWSGRSSTDLTLPHRSVCIMISAPESSNALEPTKSISHALISYDPTGTLGKKNHTQPYPNASGKCMADFPLCWAYHTHLATLHLPRTQDLNNLTRDGGNLQDWRCVHY